MGRIVKSSFCYWSNWCALLVIIIIIHSLFCSLQHEKRILQLPANINPSVCVTHEKIFLYLLVVNSQLWKSMLKLYQLCHHQSKTAVQLSKFLQVMAKVPKYRETVFWHSLTLFIHYTVDYMRTSSLSTHLYMHIEKSNHVICLRIQCTSVKCCCMDSTSHSQYTCMYPHKLHTYFAAARVAFVWGLIISTCDFLDR